MVPLMNFAKKQAAPSARLRWLLIQKQKAGRRRLQRTAIPRRCKLRTILLDRSANVVSAEDRVETPSVRRRTSSCWTSGMPRRAAALSVLLYALGTAVGPSLITESRRR